MLQQINTENFQQMLSQFSTAELESMIVKFPYFQQAHLLLAKKYQQENNPKFDQQLQLAALYVQDRELLYELFKDRNITEPVVEPVKPIIQQQQPEELVTQPQTTEPIIVAEQQVEQKEIEDQKPVVETVTVAPLSQDDITLALEEIKKTMGAIQQMSEEQKTGPVVEVMQTQSVTEPVAEETNSIEEPIVEVEEIQAAVTESIIEPVKEEEKPVLETAIAEDTTETVTEEVIQETNTEPEPEVFSRIAPHTFDEWLQAFNNKSVSRVPEKPVVIEDKTADEELNKLYATNITSDYLHGLVKEETNYAKGLEKFIEQQIQKHKQPAKGPKLQKNEVDNEIVTETMAKVYEMQKKYTLAIKAYETLALKFPEKSSLFAARIDLLKNIH